MIDRTESELIRHDDQNRARALPRNRARHPPNAAPKHPRGLLARAAREASKHRA